jgi:hypothetical protein
MSKLAFSEPDFDMLAREVASRSALPRESPLPTLGPIFLLAQAFQGLADDFARQVQRGMARSLLIGQTKLDPAIRRAIGAYLDASDDCAAAEAFANLVAAEVASAIRRRLGLDQAVTDLVTRFHRERTRYREVLEELGVRLVAVEPGTPFDPQRHQEAKAVPTDDNQEVGTVADVHRPLFEWIDENGFEQAFPAQVAIYHKR